MKRTDALHEFMTSMGLTIPRGLYDTTLANGVLASALISAAVKKFTEDNGGLVAAVSDKRITPQRYFVAEFLTMPKKDAQALIMQGRSPGTRKEMIEILDVSTQALWKYEKKYGEVLRMLRAEFGVATRLEFIALVRAATTGQLADPDASTP
ncbi:hypothetical protein ACG33_08845 [Steroidobacter denitrificans]|uniref:Uncharacterized protein n=1 Tax=Steroidobacter denitrificans TaxID=465721 RepID=A0A127FC89_STEDE|nr:hypothetical protein [Steroidobacter denitrificans]AMN47199.1 hypothetical protein ACG33_08845 [Steroidobacter denitrificans]